MGAKEDDVSDDEVEEEKQQKSGAEKEEAKGLDGVTDFVEDQEAKIDAKTVEEKLTEMRKKKEDQDKQRAERAKELAAIKIKKEDLDLMVSELPLCDKDVLEHLLRQHNGDLSAALRSAVRTFPTSTH
eukprot:TRINITY_DN113946_c0_g1_i1.p1 TRINITY_DN113946_c0_g1~~TRINITY_DN113946_c0_g1_i1.p1  ORF type:complete len:128 (+),score=55.36 TRINITY_DN113946_c0_g1_i1:78-461(+)